MLHPGQSKEYVELPESAAHNLARGKTIQVELMGPIEEEPRPAQPAPVAQDIAEALPVTDARTPAQLLVAAKEDMPYATLRREAARTLGDAWTGGRPTREEILKMLQQAAMGL